MINHQRTCTEQCHLRHLEQRIAELHLELAIAEAKNKRFEAEQSKHKMQLGQLADMVNESISLDRFAALYPKIFSAAKRNDTRDRKYVFQD